MTGATEWQGRKLTAPWSVELGFPFDTNLGNVLELRRNAVLHQDFDYVLIVDGREGSGKSVVAMQCAHFLDKDRSINPELQIVYTPKQFKKAVNSLEKFKAIIWDEAGRGLDRRRAGSSDNVDINNLMRECRQNNLFLVLVLPCFYDLDRIAALTRSEDLIHVNISWDGPKDRPLVRGGFRFYTSAGKTDLYTEKRWLTKRVYPFRPNMSWNGRFTNHYVVDEALYRSMKRDAEKSYQVDDDDKSGGDPDRCPACGNKKHYFNRTEGVNSCRCGNTWKVEDSANTEAA